MLITKRKRLLDINWWVSISDVLKAYSILKNKKSIAIYLALHALFDIEKADKQILQWTTT